MQKSRFTHRLPCGCKAHIIFTEYSNTMSCQDCGKVVENPANLRQWPLDSKTMLPIGKVMEKVNP